MKTNHEYTVVGPSGKLLSVIVEPTVADEAAGTATASGQLTATSAAGATVELTLNGSSISETVAAAGKSVLLRGVGPSLATFGVTGALTAPQLTLFNAAGTVVGTNTAWGGSSALSQVFSQVGAFALPATSSDSVLLETLPAGAYTAQLSGLSGTTGLGLTEIYDADTGVPAARLVNLSARGQVGTGGAIMIAGFVVSGSGTQTVLLRGIGPSLSQFGLTGVLATPELTLFDSGGSVIDSAAAWGGSSSLSAVFTEVGAFAIPAGSADSVLLENLPPGAYTVQLSGLSGSTGTALIEVYEVY